jgi:hypothetical protein
MILSWRIYNEKLARQNKLVAHDRPSLEDPTIKRKSFFRGENMIEADTAALVVRHSPFVVVGALPGSSTGESDVPRTKVRPSVFFLATTDNSTDGVEAAKEATFLIMQQFISAYIRDSENGGFCTSIGTFRFTSTSWQEVGPFLTCDYGWQLTVEFSRLAPDMIYNPQNWLSNDNN